MGSALADGRSPAAFEQGRQSWALVTVPTDSPRPGKETNQVQGILSGAKGEGDRGRTGDKAAVWAQAPPGDRAKDRTGHNLQYTSSGVCSGNKLPAASL